MALSKTLVQFLSYNAVGIVNTIVGFGIVFGMMLLGASASVSNMVGYGIGSVVSYFLNKRYTFNVEQNSKSMAIKFFAVLGVAYLINFAVLQGLLYNGTNPYMAQVIAATTYTVSSFVLAKYLVFKE